LVLLKLLLQPHYSNPNLLFLIVPLYVLIIQIIIFLIFLSHILFFYQFLSKSAKWLMIFKFYFFILLPFNHSLELSPAITMNKKITIERVHFSIFIIIILSWIRDVFLIGFKVLNYLSVNPKNINILIILRSHIPIEE